MSTYEELEMAVFLRDLAGKGHDANDYLDDATRILEFVQNGLGFRAARPAPAPGELDAGIEFCKRPGSGVPTNVIEAAESWQRLQWRPASEAPPALSPSRTMTEDPTEVRIPAACPTACLAAVDRLLAWAEEHEEAAVPMPVFHRYMSKVDGAELPQWRIQIGTKLAAFADPWAAILAAADALPALNGGDDNG